MDALLQEVRQEAWDGLIPAEFSMDSQEVTSLQRPLPLYLLLPRMGFLPCIAEAVSHHFGEVAPDAQRNLWLEDARSGEPLRWHVPTGVLFDLVAGREGEIFDMFHTKREESRATSNPPAAAATTTTAKAGTASASTAAAAAAVAGENEMVSRAALPWKITVHFQGCPRQQVFALENEADIRRHYTNGLKQALYLQLGSSRAGMTLAKDKQTRLWRALKANDAKVFHEMDAFLGGDGGLRLVPVRLLMGDAPPSQLPIPTECPDGTPFTLRDCLVWLCPTVHWDTAEVTTQPSKPAMVGPDPLLPPPPPFEGSLPGGGDERSLAAAAAAGGGEAGGGAGVGEGREEGAGGGGEAGGVEGGEREGGGGAGEGVGGGREEGGGGDKGARSESIAITGEPVVGQRKGIGFEREGARRAVVSEEEREREGQGGGEGGGKVGVPPLPLLSSSSLAIAGDFGAATEPVVALPRVMVQGIEVPLDAPVAQLWEALRHPDHFLYIVVRKRGA